MLGQRCILIIDDDVDYSCLLEVAFQEAEVRNPLEIVKDGWAAVKHLRALGAGDIPGLVLLDLRMPGISGLEVLRWIRCQRFLNEVPVVVFTGLEAGEEPERARQLGATSLRVKPFSYKELVQEAKTLCELYLEPHEVKHAA